MGSHQAILYAGQNGRCTPVYQPLKRGISETSPHEEFWIKAIPT
jgi:hypothetical protein